MTKGIYDGVWAPKQSLLPFDGFPFPIYPDTDLYGLNCANWNQFYLAYAERFLAEPSKDAGYDLRIAHAGLLSALDVAGVRIRPDETDRVWRIIERMSA